MSSLRIENPNRLLTYGAYTKALHSGEEIADILVSKITQPESQMIDSIKKVLQAIDTHGNLNTQSIISSTQLYTNTVNRVIKLLQEKRLVNLKTIFDRKNNEKIYSLKRNRAIIYINHLLDQKNKSAYMGEKIEKAAEELRNLLEYIGENFPERKIFVPDDLQKKYQTRYVAPISINDLPFLLAQEILYGYKNMHYCLNCFEDGIVSIPQGNDEGDFCKRCGLNAPYELGRQPDNTENRRIRRNDRKQVEDQISFVKRGKGVDYALKKSLKLNQKRETPNFS